MGNAANRAITTHHCENNDDGGNRMIQRTAPYEIQRYIAIHNGEKQAKVNKPSPAWERAAAFLAIHKNNHRDKRRPHDNYDLPWCVHYAGIQCKNRTIVGKNSNGLN